MRIPSQLKATAMLEVNKELKEHYSRYTMQNQFNYVVNKLKVCLQNNKEVWSGLADISDKAWVEKLRQLSIFYSECLYVRDGGQGDVLIGIVFPDNIGLEMSQSYMKKNEIVKEGGEVKRKKSCFMMMAESCIKKHLKFKNKPEDKNVTYMRLSDFKYNKSKSPIDNIAEQLTATLGKWNFKHLYMNRQTILNIIRLEASYQRQKLSEAGKDPDVVYTSVLFTLTYMGINSCEWPDMPVDAMLYIGVNNV